MAGVFVGARAAGVFWSPAVGYAATAGLFLAGFANAYNDYEDRDIDARIYPDRPIPAGAVSLSEARTVITTCAIGAILWSFLTSLAIGVVTIGVLAAMASYGRLKENLGVAANIVVSILASLPFVYGAWAAGNPRAGLLLMGVAAPLHFAREIVKDIDDMDGDRGRRQTLPLATSFGFAYVVSLVASAVFIPLWTIFMHFRLIAIPAAVLVAIAAWWRSQALYKAAMAVAMIAYYVSPP